MSGTKTGGLKAAQTNKLRHGEGFYVIIGQKGGQAGHTGGFYANRKLASEAGRKGGKISKRTKRIKEEPTWSLADDVDTSIVDAINLERSKSWRERFFGK
jgi:general stress protein YciG